MTTQAQDDHLRMLAEDRYRVLMEGIDQVDASLQTSKLEKELLKSIRRLVGGMIHGSTNDAEYSALDRVEDHLLTVIRDQAIEFAVVVERSRAGEREQAAEYLAPYLLENRKPEITPGA